MCGIHMSKTLRHSDVNTFAIPRKDKHLALTWSYRYLSKVNESIHLYKELLWSKYIVSCQR